MKHSQSNGGSEPALEVEKGKRPLLFALSAAFVATLLTTLFAEVILRAFFPFYTADTIEAYQYDPELGVRLKPSLRFASSTDHFREINTNPIGAVNYQDSFESYQIRIFAVGDSNTQGTGVMSDSSYPFQLDLQLNAKEDTYSFDYGVVNLGIAASGTRQAIITAQKYSKLLGPPDIILYLASPNDHHDDRLFASGYRHQHLVADNPNHGIGAALLRLISRTEIGKRFKTVLARIKRRRLLTTVESGEPSFERPIAAQLEPELLNLVKVSEQLGARLIVSWAGTDSSYRWLADWSRRNSVDFADWHPVMQQVTNAMPGLSVSNPHSGSHFRSWVQGTIAQAFAKKIIAGSQPHAPK
jgi:hypothetical protein